MLRYVGEQLCLPLECHAVCGEDRWQALKVLQQRGLPCKRVLSRDQASSPLGVPTYLPSC